MHVDKIQSHYYKCVGTKEVLTAAIERELFAEYKKTKSIQIRNRIVEGCLRFVIQCAHKHKVDHTTLEDLISAGNIGLLIAVDRFDCTRGIRFLSYAAHWISLYMRNEYDRTNDASGVVHIPSWKKKAMRRVTAVRNKMQQQEGHVAENKTICDAAKVSEKQLVEIENAIHNASAPDYTLVEKKITHSAATTTPPAPGERADKKAVTLVISKGMGTLTPMEKWVLKAYYGFGDDTQKSLRDIGASLGCTSERVRQLKEKAMCKVKRTLADNGATLEALL